MNTFESWGRFPKAGQQLSESLSTLKDAELLIKKIKSSGDHFLPRGLGRSYGDSCLVNNDDRLIVMTDCHHVIEFDQKNGIVRTEAGVTFEQLLPLILPAGWFFPVTPGTKYITVAGAVANDIHGKNHHRAGNFGNHVAAFELLRSDGRRILCSELDSPDSEGGRYFRATIGGLGLTGLILWVEFRLKAVRGPLIDQEVIKFKGIDEFICLSHESESNFEYTVSWVDSLSHGSNLRGRFFRGNHSDQLDDSKSITKKKIIIPSFSPGFFLNGLSIRAFNFLYYHSQFRERKKSTNHFDSFFYPLDSILHWNRIYGSAGFLQYQFVVPFEQDNGFVVNRILERIENSGNGSFLTVLKIFGKTSGRGMLSFPRPGMTLALDFKNTGKNLYLLLDELDEIVLNAKGAIYPAKDARMSKKTFETSFPEAGAFREMMDPAICSRFSKRIGLVMEGK